MRRGVALRMTRDYFVIVCFFIPRHISGKPWAPLARQSRRLYINYQLGALAPAVNEGLLAPKTNSATRPGESTIIFGENDYLAMAADFKLTSTVEIIISRTRAESRARGGADPTVSNSPPLLGSEYCLRKPLQETTGKKLPIRRKLFKK